MPSLCSVSTCSNAARRRGMCGAHYQRMSKHGDVLEHIPVRKTRGLPSICAEEDCSRRRHALGYCSTHYARLQKHGSTELQEKEPREWVSKAGYVMVYDPQHPLANSSGNVFKHRAVMARHIGRMLLPAESVHHINGNRQDNRLENLELWSKSQPAGQRVEDKVSWALEILGLYKPGALADFARTGD